MFGQIQAEIRAGFAKLDVDKSGFITKGKIPIK